MSRGASCELPAGLFGSGACEPPTDPPATSDQSTHLLRPTRASERALPTRTALALSALLCAVLLAARALPSAAVPPSLATRAALRAAAAAEPNPPAWPSSVLVFSPGDVDAQARIDAVYARNGGDRPADHAQFSDARFALLFEPGAYAVSVPVGYYTQVLGLGATPRDVVFEAPGKGVYCTEVSTVCVCAFSCLDQRLGSHFYSLGHVQTVST